MLARIHATSMRNTASVLLGTVFLSVVANANPVYAQAPDLTVTSVDTVALSADCGTPAVDGTLPATVRNGAMRQRFLVSACLSLRTEMRTARLRAESICALGLAPWQAPEIR